MTDQSARRSDPAIVAAMVLYLVSTVLAVAAAVVAGGVVAGLVVASVAALAASVWMAWVASTRTVS